MADVLDVQLDGMSGVRPQDALQQWLKVATHMGLPVRVVNYATLIGVYDHPPLGTVVCEGRQFVVCFDGDGRVYARRLLSAEWVHQSEACKVGE